MRKYLFCLLASSTLLVLYPNCGQAQKTKGDSVKHHNNIIRFNLSNFLLFGGRNIIFGYERLVKPSQSFSINFGVTSIPNLSSIITDSISIKRQTSKSGFNVSADYRFYLKKENKHRAPRGIYIGPYVNYNNIHKEAEWNIGKDNDPVTTETDFMITGAGIQLGYQFILFKRMTLDFVMIGPGVAGYKFNTTIDRNLSVEDREQLQQAVQQALSNKYPGMNLVFGEHQISANGTLRVTSIGYRYLIHIGYTF